MSPHTIPDIYDFLLTCVISVIIFWQYITYLRQFPNFHESLDICKNKAKIHFKYHFTKNVKRHPSPLMGIDT